MTMTSSRDSLRSAAEEQPRQTKNRRWKSNGMSTRYGEPLLAARWDVEGGEGEGCPSGPWGLLTSFRETRNVEAAVGELLQAESATAPLPQGISAVREASLRAASRLRGYRYDEPTPLKSRI